MTRKTSNPNFDQMLDTLRAHSFDVAPYAGVAGSVLVSKQCAGAILTAAPDGRVDFLVTPGVLMGGEVARLVDRGYQKFIKAGKYEAPATASQLHAVHQFAEELKLFTGAADLYNEALGTTSDLYEYDRLKGRESTPEEPGRP